MQNRNELPVEPSSNSEVLSATHLFTVEIVKSEEGDWTAGPDRKQRRLRLTLRLLERFKGDLDVPPGLPFLFETTQYPVSPFFNLAYMGLWSHADTSARLRYLIVSRGASRFPGDLMQEGPCKRLFDAELASEVRAAIEVEPTAFQTADLLRFAFEYRAHLDELFGRYFWVRIGDAFRLRTEETVVPVLRIIYTPDGRISFRQTVIEGLDRALTGIDYPVSVLPLVLRVLFALLVQPEAATLRDTLIQAQIFSTVFRNETVPRVSAAVVFPNQAELNAYSIVLADFELDRAPKLRAWLLAN